MAEAYIPESVDYVEQHRTDSEQTVEMAREATADFFEDNHTIDNVSAPEKVIFCIDAFLHRDAAQHALSTILTDYINVKRRISIKQVDFQVVLMANKGQAFIPINSLKDVNNVLVAMKKVMCEDVEIFDFSKIFLSLAEKISLPDPSFHSHVLPPPHVYHFIVIYGRCKFNPKLTDPNAYYYLMNSPFVALDVLYLHSNNDDIRMRKQISKALKGLVSHNKGCFEEQSYYNLPSCLRSFRYFLGHPLIRYRRNPIFNFYNLLSYCDQ